VRRLLDQTPRVGQRMLFSATLDAGVDVLVRRYLTDPVVHSVEEPRTAVDAVTHHVLQVTADDRFPVLVDLAAAPGRTVVFTRTKHGAKALTRKLLAAGVAATELHGNLAQGARSRNLEAFSTGTATTLVATDIAARGIHVDDVALVIHADPPAEHKAYLHRSGRTARAGATGTVVTLMTDGQVAEVRELTRRAGIKAVTTRLRPGDALLRSLAPGERVLVTPPAETRIPQDNPRRGRGGGGGVTGRGRSRSAASAARRGGEPAATSGGRRGGGSHTGASSGGSHSSSHGGSSGGSRGAAAHGGRAERTPGAGGQPTGAAAFSARARPARRGGR
jgi:superfamily II DNA/RNA helicase